MQAVVCELGKSHHYTHGRKVSVVTDCRPLVAICTKPLSIAPKWQQNVLGKYTALHHHSTIQTMKGDSLSGTLTSKPEKEELQAVNDLTLQPIQDHQLIQIHWKMTEGPNMTTLAEVFAREQPDDKHLLPETILSLQEWTDCPRRFDTMKTTSHVPCDFKIKENVHAGNQHLLQESKRSNLARHVYWDKICENWCRQPTNRTINCDRWQ